jgi:hypothetical protein
VERTRLAVQTLLVETTTPVETMLLVVTTTVVETVETATILQSHRVLSKLQ